MNHGLTHTEKMESTPKECPFYLTYFLPWVSFRSCLWEASHLYNRSSLGRAVLWFEKGTKTTTKKVMSDSHGKNRSYVKINLSVLQHLLHKPEPKKRISWEDAFSLWSCFSYPSLQFCVTLPRWWGIKREVPGDFESCSASACAAGPETGRRTTMSSWSLDLSPSLTLTNFMALAKVLPSLSPSFLPYDKAKAGVNALRSLTPFFSTLV